MPVFPPGKGVKFAEKSLKSALLNKTVNIASGFISVRRVWHYSWGGSSEVVNSCACFREELCFLNRSVFCPRFMDILTPWPLRQSLAGVLTSTPIQHCHPACGSWGEGHRIQNSLPQIPIYSSLLLHLNLVGTKETQPRSASVNQFFKRGGGRKSLASNIFSALS